MSGLPRVHFSASPHSVCMYGKVVGTHDMVLCVACSMQNAVINVTG